MLMRAFGSTDLRISAVGLGVFAIGGWLWGQQDDADSITAIHAALDAGVNWIDTAPLYGAGRADRIVAEALKRLPASRRPWVFTKFGLHLVNGNGVGDGSRARVIADCDYNLKVFGVETLDLFQLHWPTATPIAETAHACGELLAAGKIRAIGVSNFSAAQLEEWRLTGVPIHSLQCPYSLILPKVEQAELPWCAQHQVGALAYSPLHRGLLSGTWSPDKVFASDDHRATRPDFQGPRLQRFLATVDELKLLGHEHGLTVPQLAIGYLLANKGLSAAIVGARNAAQGSALAHLSVELTPVQISAINGILTRLRHDFPA